MSNSNIHGIGESRNNGNNDDDSTPLFMMGNYKGDPREQPVFSFLKQTLCPCFKFKSFSFIIIIVNIAIYIFSLFPHGLNEFQKEFYFLPPSGETLDKLGDLNGRKIRKTAIQGYRWIAHNFLHAYFNHIFSNCFSIIIIGTILEHLIGTWKYIAVYALSGILGSLFSVLVNYDSVSVGASICICGLISCLIAHCVINWNSLTAIYGCPNRCFIITFPILIAFMNISMIVTGEKEDDENKRIKINAYGHLGGIIFGFFLGLIFIKPKNESDVCCFTYKILFYTGLVVCISFALIGFPCFYTLDKYKAN
jgi:membrane associated rhomboid family serine protease